MVRYNLILVILFISINTFAQKQDYVWTFGIDQSPEPGIQGMQIDFKDSIFQVNQVNMAHGNLDSHASICDSAGNLLFYTNGCSMINRNKELMPHGDTLNHNVFKELLNWDNCDIGYPGIQNDVILSDPGYSDGYYLIHKPQILDPPFQDITVELWVTYIDMSLDGGLGDVVFFDSVIFAGNILSAYLEAIPHANGLDWWLLQPVVEDSLFLTYLIDDTGFHRMADQNTHKYFNEFRSSASGTARFSPDGTKYAIYYYYDNIQLYDFDRSTGLLRNHQEIVVFSNPDVASIKFGSIEWSPNSRFLYVTNRDSLLQVDLWESDPHEGIRLIDVYDGTANPFANTFYLQTLGPDCRIYISSTNGTYSYHVINKPNELGLACDFQQNGIQLPQPHGSANVPLFPRFRVDEEEKCDPKYSSIFGNWVYYRRDLEVYPNPAQDFIYLEIPNGIGEAELMVYDNSGRTWLSDVVRSNVIKKTINISDFPCGIYHVEIIPINNPERILYGGQIVKGE